MLSFNLWSWNSRIFPAIGLLLVRQGDGVRLRVGNRTMTNHPIHIHGHEFVMNGADGGPMPKSARWPEATCDIAVGQMRQLDCLVDEVGEWTFRRHKSPHTMSVMGHNMQTMIDVDPRGLMRKANEQVPNNTAALMTGEGLFGAIGMSGMFSVIQVRMNRGQGTTATPAGPSTWRARWSTRSGACTAGPNSAQARRGPPLTRSFPMRLLFISTLVAVAWLAAPPAAHAHGNGHAKGPAVKQEQKPWGIAGSAKAARRTLELGMSDNMRFTPDRIEVREGETLRIRVRNSGKVMHEFVIGTPAELAGHAALMAKFPDMEHDEPYMVHVPPGQTGEIVWTFNRAGEFEFACLIAGHFQAGMVGKISVRPKAVKP